MNILVVGGGLTGAGILRAATRLGLRTLLVERKDFAWGTSSRSTKLVHGVLRYLAQGQFGVTRESERERERLVKEGVTFNTEPLNLGTHVIVYMRDPDGNTVELMEYLRE